MRIRSHIPLFPLWVVVLSGSVAPLGLALVSQYGFGLHPCELCIWQRVPYGILAGLGALAWLYRTKAVWMSRMLLMAVFLWLVEAGLAVYHVGVEQHWWVSASGCSGAGQAGQSIDELRAAIMGAATVSCDQPEFVFLGLSMAGWNMLFALMFVLYGIYLRTRDDVGEKV